MLLKIKEKRKSRGRVLVVNRKQIKNVHLGTVNNVKCNAIDTNQMPISQEIGSSSLGLALQALEQEVPSASDLLVNPSYSPLFERAYVKEEKEIQLITKEQSEKKVTEEVEKIAKRGVKTQGQEEWHGSLGSVKDPCARHQLLFVL